MKTTQYKPQTEFEKQYWSRLNEYRSKYPERYEGRECDKLDREGNERDVWDIKLKDFDYYDEKVNGCRESPLYG